MPATGLKIFETVACLPWSSISYSFQNNLKTSGHQGYVFLEFWCWILVLFLPDIGFQQQKSLWSSLMYFLFNGAPYVLFRWKIWTAGGPIQHLDSSTTVFMYAPPYHQRHWLLNWTLITCWKVSLLFSPEDMVFVISNKKFIFELIWP